MIAINKIIHLELAHRRLMIRKSLVYSIIHNKRKWAEAPIRALVYN